LEDWAAYLIRLDAAKHLGQKKPKCKDGDECGGSCIEKGLRCNVKTGAAKTAAARALKGVKLSSNVATPPSAYTAIEADERKLRLNTYETAIVYDAEGKELFRKKGGSSEVDFTAAECAKMKDAIVTHNHPSLTALDAKYDGVYQGGSFSASDMIAAAGLDVAEIRAVGPEGTYRLVRPAKGWPSAETMDRVYRQKAESEYGSGLEKIRRGLKPIGEANVDHWANTSTATAKELGIDYSFRRTGITKADRESIDKTTASGRKQFKSDMTSSVVRQWVEAGVAVSLVGVIAGGGGLLAREMSGKKAERPAEKKAPEPSVVAPSIKAKPEPSVVAPRIKAKPEPSVVAPSIKAKPEPSVVAPNKPAPSTFNSDRDPSPKAYGVIREIEKSTRLNRFESATALDVDGNILFQIDGGEHSVRFSPEHASLMKDSILTHNHPALRYGVSDGTWPLYHGGSLSESDFRTAFQTNPKEIRAVAAEGVYRILRPKQGWPSDVELEAVYAEAAERHTPELQRKTAKMMETATPAGPANPDEFSASLAAFSHMAAMDVAKHYGIEYEYHPVRISLADKAEAEAKATQLTRKQKAYLKSMAKVNAKYAKKRVKANGRRK